MNINKRISTALEFLKDGQSFKVGELRLSAEKPDSIMITGWSQYKIFENLTKSQSLRELEEIKSLYNRMLEISQELREFTEKRAVEFYLYFDDYGKGSIEICNEKGGILTWVLDL